MSYVSSKHERLTVSVQGGGNELSRYTKIKNVSSLIWYNEINAGKAIKSLSLFTYEDDYDKNEVSNILHMDEVVKRNLKLADTSFITNQNMDISAERGRIIVHTKKINFTHKNPAYIKMYNSLSTDLQNHLKDIDVDENVIDAMTVLSGNYGKYIIYKDDGDIQKIRDILVGCGFGGGEIFDDIPTEKL